MPNKNINLPPDCPEDYLRYCRLVDTVAEGITTDSANLSSPSENLELETQYDFNPDPNKNEGFKKFSEEVCNKKRVSKSNNKVSMNFDEYKNSICIAVKVPPPECNPAQHAALVRKFMSEYIPVPVEGGDPQLVAGYESIFTGVLSDPPKVGVTSADMQDVKGGSVSYSDLQKKGYPSSASSSDLAQLAQFSKEANLEDKSGDAPFTPTAEEGALAPVLGNPALASSVASAAAEINSGKDEETMMEEIDKERESLKDKIDNVSGDLKDARKTDDKNTIAEMEKRLKELEDRLAKKTAEYESLSEKEKEIDKEEKAKAAANKNKKSSTGSVDEVEDPTVSGKATGGSAEDKAGGRFPASVSDGNYAAKGGSAGSSVSAAAGAAAGKVTGTSSKFNAALLAKYGITVDGPTEGKILLATERTDKDLQKVIGAQEGQGIPIVVSNGQYEKFKINDLESLKDIYDEKLKGVAGTVVKLSVTSKGGGEPLEFYVIREGDKVVFQAVRKHQLKNMQDALKTL